MLRHALLLVLLLVAVQDVWSAPVVMEVRGTANIFRAGVTGSTPGVPGGEGTLPAQYPGALPSTPDPYLVLYFPNMTGQVSYNSTSGHLNGPDGLDTSPGSATPTGRDTLIASANGIAGISKSDRLMFLVGVFLGAGAPNNNTGYENNNYDDGDLRTEFRPVIGQTFYIGDGRTSTGQLQRFYVPDGATRLYLGFADGDSFAGAPSYYDDNGGAFTVTANFDSAVPEPGTMVLVSLALLGGFWRFRNRG